VAAGYLFAAPAGAAVWLLLTWMKVAPSA